jgi:hypothetical protein
MSLLDATPCPPESFIPDSLQLQQTKFLKAPTGKSLEAEIRGAYTPPAQEIKL